MIRFQFAISCIFEKSSFFDIVICCLDKLCRFSQKSSFSNSENSSKMHQIVNQKIDFSKMLNIVNREIEMWRFLKNVHYRESRNQKWPFLKIRQKYTGSRIAKSKMTILEKSLKMHQIANREIEKWRFFENAQDRESRNRK